MSAPEISILMPTFNYARFLPEALESCLAQDFADFELLVVDDASTDDTTEVMRAWVARDPRIRFLRHPSNLGMVENWNHSLRLARGRLVKFLFADDKLCRPDALSRLRQALEDQPGAVLAASARAILDERSATVQMERPLRGGPHDGRKVIMDSLLEGNNPIGEPSAVLFRKADAARGFDTAYRQFVDLEMWFHLLERGGLAYDTGALCGFRRHPQQQTAVNNKEFSIRENLMLAGTYGLRPEIPRARQEEILHAVGRGLRRHPAARPQFEALERQFTSRHGGPPHYAAARIKYTLRRLFGPGS